MPPAKRDIVHIGEMFNACGDIIAFLADSSFNSFAADKKTGAAIEMQLLINGEAAAHVSETFKAEYPDIPWKRIIGLKKEIPDINP